MLVLCLFTLTGCNLFVRNDAKYYSQIVATYGDESFTMEDLETFASLYSSNYENSISSTEELYKQLLDDMINRKIMCDWIVDNGYVDYNGIAFDVAYKEDITREVYDQIRTELETYEEAVRKEQGIVDEEEDTEDTEDSKTEEEVFESEYERDLTSDTFKLTFKYDDFAPDMTPAGEFYQIGDDPVFNAEVWSRYIRDLETDAKRKGKKDLTELGLFNARKEMWYEILREQKIINVFTNKYLSTAVVNTDSAVTAFTTNYNNDYQKYNIDTNNATTNANHRAAYIEAMADSPESIYYHIDDTFVQVTHILLSFDDYITADGGLIDQWKEANNYPTEDGATATEEQQQKLQAYLDSLVSTIKTEDGKTVSEVYALVKNAVDSQYSLYDKADAFNDYIYDYSDPNSGSQNATFGFVVPVNEEDGDNNLVSQFADGARDLYLENANGGNVKYVVSEYGVHILLNLGGVRNIIDYNALNGSGITAEKLWETRVYPLSTKSYFDALVTSFNQPDSNTALDNCLSDAKIEMKKNGIEIKTYYYRMESLWK